MSAAPGVCVYCGSRSLRQIYSGLYHKLKKDHGPFNWFVCNQCGSGSTAPLPSPESLAQLYSMHQYGLPQEAVAHGEHWHPECVDRISSLAGLSPEKTFTWIDFGAGTGAMASMFAKRFPKSMGWAIDLHERPPLLEQFEDGLNWVQADLNQFDLRKIGSLRADIVYATAVWEHVLYPDLFVRNMIGMLKDGGLLYLLCPNYNSLARKLMGRKWPYFHPGEHLFMPTPVGSRECLSRELSLAKCPEARATIWAKPRLLRYSVQYALRRSGLENRLSGLFGSGFAVLMPVGALESVLTLG